MDVVIVDDQPSARTMLRHIVQDIGPQLDVHDFGEPDLALEWCNENRPDLLLQRSRWAAAPPLSAMPSAGP
ncbi:MAG: response regulator [Lysobacteraceae bacterium]|nr:MAG: response regulator [Xanthomonadaceae bacterium]